MKTSESAAQRPFSQSVLALLFTAVASAGVMAPVTSHAASGQANADIPDCPPVWSASTVYTAGNDASQGSHGYKAKWWTQGDEPATHNGDGQVWDKPYDCKPVIIIDKPERCDPWLDDYKYPKKSFVTQAGQGYKALKKSVGKDPATNNGPKGSGQPWTKTDKCLPPEGGDPYYTGYYPSWQDRWFDATGKTHDQVYQESQFARIPSNYTHVIVAFAQPDFSWGGATFGGTGLNFESSPSSIKVAIDVLHERGLRVLLAVGGASYNNGWELLAAEGAAGSGPRITALTNIMKDLGFDGLDIDYEKGSDITEYANASRAMRAAVDAAGPDAFGNPRILAMPGWSTGADCIAATASDADCGGRVSVWGGNAGRERLLAKQFAKFDLVNVMSYDARFENYDGVVAWNSYRTIFPKTTVVSIGLETSPEGWAGANLVVNDADAQCEGSILLKDQYGTTLNKPYSVNRYVSAVKNSTHPNRNEHDGAMLWNILKTATGNCGSAPLASPGAIGQKVFDILGSGKNDPVLQAPPFK